MGLGMKGKGRNRAIILQRTVPAAIDFTGPGWRSYTDNERYVDCVTLTFDLPTSELVVQFYGTQANGTQSIMSALEGVPSIPQYHTTRHDRLLNI